MHAKVQAVKQVLDIQTLLHGEDTTTVRMNDIARIELVLAQPLIADLYAENRSTGSFILIDTATHQTAAAGMIVAVE